MILWTLKVAALVFAIWFLNGLRKVIFLPRYRLLDCKEVGFSDGMHWRIEIERRRWVPPFDIVREIWVSFPCRHNRRFPFWVRLGDGSQCSTRQDERLYDMCRAAQVNDVHTESLL